jgi:hypothetical protein
MFEARGTERIGLLLKHGIVASLECFKRDAAAHFMDDFGQVDDEGLSGGAPRRPAVCPLIIP